MYFDVAGCCGPNQRVQRQTEFELYGDGEWNHYAFVKNEFYTAIYQNGELFADSEDNDAPPGDKDPLSDITEFFIGSGPSGDVRSYHGLIDEFGVWDEALDEQTIQDIMQNGLGMGATRLQAGDANQDLEFNQLDLVQVQIAAKYLSGNAATWGEGDWDGAPGGEVGSPPPGDGQFNQLDIIAALNGGVYLTGPYAAVAATPAIEGDGQTSVIYNPGTGEVAVDAPAGTELTSINIDSAGAFSRGTPPPTWAAASTTMPIPTSSKPHSAAALDRCHSAMSPRRAWPRTLCSMT